jgi:hypothetical protein
MLFVVGEMLFAVGYQKIQFYSSPLYVVRSVGLFSTFFWLQYDQTSILCFKRSMFFVDKMLPCTNVYVNEINWNKITLV